MELSKLDTPALTVDLDVLEKNLVGMADRIQAARVGLRPHVKTHKTVELAEMQMEHGAAGISVAKLGEAEVMAEFGMDDILVANEVVGTEKLARLAKLSRMIRIRSCVDSMSGAMSLSEAAANHGVGFDVMLDVNTGLDRTGVQPEQAVELGKAVDALQGVMVVGVFSYAGYSATEPNESRRRQWAEMEASTAVAISRELLAAGVGAGEVSVAGTPTAAYAASVSGVTEVRPGTYVFNDLNYSIIGACNLSECALTIRARVVSKPSPDRAVVDAGSKVLTSDRRADGVPGYGYVVGAPDTRLEALWEEHGVLRLDDEGRQLNVGDVIGIIPNHVCPTVNLADAWYGVRDGTVEQTFAVTARGKTY
jgi:D-serine deaminase-like pyridoxal phosphate-dependent protein